MKKILIMVALFVLAMVILVPVSIVAAASKSDTSVEAAKRTLAIKAPDAVSVGEKFKILVTEKSSGNPVSGAGVWAVRFSRANVPAVDAASAASDSLEVFLGWTDNTGIVAHAFKQTGLFILVTFKDTFNPGFADITAKATQKALAIKAPVEAIPGEPITIHVFDRNLGSGVAQAGIWAVSTNNTALPTSSNQKENIALIKRSGQFLGWTDNNGNLTFKIDRPNPYLLVATKDSYLPGFAKINIQQYKALVIKAPSVVKVLEPVPIRVLEKSVLTVEIPVPIVGVWAISANDVAALEKATDYTALAQKYGIFLGWTNEQGYVSPTPSFQKPGNFWVVAIKEGYQAGFTQITVKPAIATATPIPLEKSPTTALKTPAKPITSSNYQPITISTPDRINSD